MKNLSFVTKMILIGIVAIFVNACDKDEVNITYDLTGNWIVVSFENYESSTIIKKTEDNTWSQFNNGDITVSFDMSDLTHGKISGKNVTNFFSGDYMVDSKGSISINNVIWTEINEPEWGRLFHSIVNAESFELRNGSLRIFYNNKKNCITLERF